MPVEHRGDFAGATGAAGGTLSELGARFDGKTYLGHGVALLQSHDVRQGAAGIVDLCSGAVVHGGEIAGAK
ncbi:hypothetical protein GCM10009565_57920 [Amycolatopsis albidoflavus]